MSGEDDIDKQGDVRKYLQRYTGTLIDRDKLVKAYAEAVGSDYQTVYNKLSEDHNNLDSAGQLKTTFVYGIDPGTALLPIVVAATMPSDYHLQILKPGVAVGATENINIENAFSPFILGERVNGAVYLDKQIGTLASAPQQTEHTYYQLAELITRRLSVDSSMPVQSFYGFVIAEKLTKHDSQHTGYANLDMVNRVVDQDICSEAQYGQMLKSLEQMQEFFEQIPKYKSEKISSVLKEVETEIEQAWNNGSTNERQKNFTCR